MREAMWVRIVRGFETQRSGISVHLLDEVLDWLIWGHSSLVVLVSRLIVLNICWHWVRVLTCLLSLLAILLLLLFIIFVPSGHLKQILTEMLCKTCCCVISTGEHEGMQEVIDREDIT